MKEVSIIIPAYRASRFIHECLDSIKMQDYFKRNDSFEILVGVDGCRETWNRLKEIAPNYRNLRRFWFSENRGPYVVRNTLAYKAEGEMLIFFDADDLMLQGLVGWTMQHKEIQQAVIRYAFINFFEDIPVRKIRYPKSCGIFGIRKDIFKELGGFKDWKCAADREFHVRAQYAGIRSIVSEHLLFHRRKHSGCITSQPEMSATSRMRQDYHKKIRSFRQSCQMRARRAFSVSLANLSDGTVSSSPKMRIEPVLTECSEAFMSRPQDIRDYQQYFRA